MASATESGRTHNMPYVRAFLTENPEVGLDILSNRYKDAQKLDTELADYFKERASIEDQYAKSLVKSSKKLFMSDPTVLGKLAPVWSKLLEELTETSNIHAALAHSIMTEIEVEMRNQSQRYHAPQQMLQHGMSEFATSGKKNKKNKKGLDRTGSMLFKRGTSEKNILQNQAESTWSVKGPEILSDLQVADTRRLDHVKRTIQKFEEIQTEHLKQQISMADTTLSLCISYDVEEEVNDFARTHGRNLKVLQPRGQGYMQKTQPTPTRTAPAAVPLSAPAPAPAPVPVAPPSTTQPTTPTSVPQQPSPQLLPRPTGTLSNGAPRKSSNRESKLFSALTSIRRKPKGEKLHDTPSDYNSQMEIIAEPPSLGRPQLEQADSSQYYTPIRQLSEASLPVQSPSAVPVDDQGYSVPPATKSRIPDFDTGDNVSDVLFDDEQQRAANVKYHVDIKQNTVHEENEEDNHTLQRMASMLKEKNSSVPRRPRGRRDLARNSTLNERWPTDASLNVATPHGVVRDASVSTFDSNSYNPFLASSVESHHSPTSMTPSSSVSASPTMGSMELPAMHSPLPTVEESSSLNLAASIVETVNLSLTNGEVEHIQVIGEIALQCSGPASTADMLVFRVEKQNNIESLLPNKNILRTLNEEEGIFGIGRAEASALRGRNVVCFKYKLKPSSISSNDVLPLNFIPAWRVEETCIKLMIKCQANANMTAKHATLWVKPGSKNVTSVQSTPQGTWNPERTVLSWDADNIKMDGSSNQLLARFAITPNTATTKPMVALTFSSDGPSASNISITTIEQPTESNQHRVQAQVIHRTLRSGRVIGTS
ncbi:Muniscin C-terminal mu homology domain-containing protein [Umbelopsis sp. AD052]|nr:Muniscin C-terminal mu homology domain-containing protein [Umbelopsis sp. AD052]